MLYNVTKCRVMHFDYYHSHAEYFLLGNTLDRTALVKDHGSVITTSKFTKQCIVVESKTKRQESCHQHDGQS